MADSTYMDAVLTMKIERRNWAEEKGGLWQPEELQRRLRYMARMKRERAERGVHDSAPWWWPQENQVRGVPPMSEAEEQPMTIFAWTGPVPDCDEVQECEEEQAEEYDEIYEDWPAEIKMEEAENYEDPRMAEMELQAMPVLPLPKRNKKEVAAEMMGCHPGGPGKLSREMTLICESQVNGHLCKWFSVIGKKSVFRLVHTSRQQVLMRTGAVFSFKGTQELALTEVTQMSKF